MIRFTRELHTTLVTVILCDLAINMLNNDLYKCQNSWIDLGKIHLTPFLLFAVSWNRSSEIFHNRQCSRPVYFRLLVMFYLEESLFKIFINPGLVLNTWQWNPGEPVVYYLTHVKIMGFLIYSQSNSTRLRKTLRPFIQNYKLRSHKEI